MITAAEIERAELVACCDVCGELVLFVRNIDSTQRVVHSGCPQATVTIWTTSPRKLGVITGITE